MTNDSKKTVLGWMAMPPTPTPTPSGDHGSGQAPPVIYDEQTMMQAQYEAQQHEAQQAYELALAQQAAHHGAPGAYGNEQARVRTPKHSPYPYPYPQHQDQEAAMAPTVLATPLEPQLEPHTQLAHPAQPAPYPQPYPQQYPTYGQHAQAHPYTPAADPYAQPVPAQPFHGQMAAPTAPAADPHVTGKRRPIEPSTGGASVRLGFIRRTYLHLLGAILAFSGLLYLLMTNAFLGEKVSAPFVKFALGGRWNWGVVLAVFMAVSWVADYWASHARSKAMQYAGLGFYVIAEAVIFVPLLAIVEWKTQGILARGGEDPNIIRDSAFITLGIFTALTASVFLTRKDFSYLKSGLVMASGAAMMLIVLSLVFGFQLGLVFSFAMVFLAAAYILYQTSQVLAHYDPNQHVAASLALFSSVALMFWYVIRIVMKLRE
jgi:FtsH-binding integral membrane protein